MYKRQVIRKIAAPHVCNPYADQLVLVIIGKTPATITQQVAIEIVSVTVRRLEIDCDAVGVSAPINILGNRREGIITARPGLIRAGKRDIRIQHRIGPVSYTHLVDGWSGFARSKTAAVV